jgi:6-phosphogluconolactonase (cycloisomerase 2 family)
MSARTKTCEPAALAIVVIAIVSIVAAAAPESASQPAAGSPRLVAVQELPAGDMCAWEGPTGRPRPELTAPVQRDHLFSARPQGMSASSLMAPLRSGNLFSLLQQGRTTVPTAAYEVNRPPVFRTLADTYPTYTSVGVNLQTDEVVLQDNNLWSTRIYNRLANTPDSVTPPKRVIQGPETHIQYNNGLYIDPSNGDMYSVESDTGDRMVVCARDANGNETPKRELHPAHRVYGIAVDEGKQELYITVEYPPSVDVYRKDASDDEPPIRRIKGDRTKLETPHGIAIDPKNRLLFVNNWGQSMSFDGSEIIKGCCRQQPVETGNPGTGRFNPPSITVYPLDAGGSTPPLRVIQGDRTQLNWPGNMAVDQGTGDLYVANSMGHSVLVFTGMTSAQGNVAPTRVIKGNRTSLVYPTGVFADTRHQELWVSNLGNSSATVYPLKANGNVAPVRMIRGAPGTHTSLTFGRTAAVAYDRNRQEILVPN